LFYPNYRIQNTPNKSHYICFVILENGDFLGLDLGSTNFRVVLVKFTNGVADTKTKYYNLPSELLTGPADGVIIYFHFIVTFLNTI